MAFQVVVAKYSSVTVEKKYIAMSAMAKAQKSKGDAFVQEAEALLNKKSWFSSSKERNAEDAAEVFEKAANAYKVGGLNQEAGDVYSRAAEIYRDRLSNFNDASKCLNNAGECRSGHRPAIVRLHSATVLISRPDIIIAFV